MRQALLASQDLSIEQFVERFERPRLPVVITGLTDDWPAAGHWLPDALIARCGDHKFKVRCGKGMRYSICSCEWMVRQDIGGRRKPKLVM
jgi:hypothetical protein